MIMGVRDTRETRIRLAQSSAAFEPVGGDGYWSLTSSSA